jgi:23S rRNA (pseudouridine1915-N3)-methyltransferase
MSCRIKLVVIGKPKMRYLQEGVSVYIKRLSAFCKLEIVELKDEGVPKEAEKLTKYLGTNTYVLDANGKQFSSEEFADFIKKREDLTFIIGGSDGMDASFKKQAQLISLSKMTYLHEMTKLILLEQVYRAFMINNNRIYHK